MINNAGIIWDNVIQKMTDEQWDSILDVHLKAPFRILRAAQSVIAAAVKEAREAGRPVPCRKVVNVSSVAGIGGNAGQASYAAAKAGIIGLTKSLAKEWGRYNITVNTVAFGLIKTRLTEVPADGSGAIDVRGRTIKVSLNPELLATMERTIPLGRTGLRPTLPGRFTCYASPNRTTSADRQWSAAADCSDNGDAGAPMDQHLSAAEHKIIPSRPLRPSLEGGPVQGGTTVPEFPGIGEWLARRADRTPSRLALVFEGTTWTYAELDGESERIATGLRGRGVARGDRVAYLGVNHPAYLAFMFGCAKLGAIATLVNWRLSAPEIRFILADAGASGLIYDAALAPAIDAIRSDLPDAFLVRNDLEVKPVLPGLAADGKRSTQWAHVSGAEAALLMYTSGTQANPKGVVITHDNLLASIISIGCTFDIGPGHVALVSAPLFHIGGINVNLLETFLKGGTVIIERAFDPGRTLKLMAEHRVNSYFGAPVMVQMIAEHRDFDNVDLSSLGWVYCGGAPVNTRVVRQWARRGIPVCNGYGMTEAAPLISIVGPDEAVDKLGSAGKPGFFTDVRIVDEQDAEVPAGTHGEILIKGPNVVSGYWNRPEINAKAFRDGWFHTGDVGVLTDDGYLHVVDRLKDMIISGGENVASAEVEQCLLEHPGVADAAVVGKPHEKWGEVPFAFVVAAPGKSITPDEIRAFTAERLARFKQPAGIEIVASLPRNATGKLLKQELRRRVGEQPVKHR